MIDGERLNRNLHGPREELAEEFHNLTDPRHIAALLEIDYHLLVYYLYKISPDHRYRVFEINKRRSGTATRTISAPNRSLKIIQSKLAQVLSSVYSPKASVHGFCKGRSILTNAIKHTDQKFVLNLDLLNFFPSINFGRVRGMFMATPYNLNEKVSTVLAQICCFNNELPQGAPTSPIVSNMICAKMDTQLRILAQLSRCNYTRYADDITFSTSCPKFPAQLATIITEEKGNYLQLGDHLKTIIETNGFRINSDKVRLQTKTNRQEVTGLVTNQFPNIRRRYVRQVRAMLHSWEKYGLEKAEEEHFKKYRIQSRSPYKDLPRYRSLSFRDILLGKIGFIGSIRGKTDFIYIKLLNKLVDLSPDLAKQKAKISDTFPVGTTPSLRVLTEGPTDWMHIEAALKSLQESGYYNVLPIDLYRYHHDMGHDKLLSICEAYSTVPVPGSLTHVFIFDRDNQSIVRKVNDGKKVKRWSNQVFSFSIPVPKHRAKTPDISIEFNYQDEEIQRLDTNGRRLFINSEFHQHSQRHKTLDLFCRDRSRFPKNNGIRIVDDDVFDSENKDVALPKKQFAEYVLNRKPNFDNFDFSAFRGVFDNLEKILQL